MLCERGPNYCRVRRHFSATQTIMPANTLNTVIYKLTSEPTDDYRTRSSSIASDPGADEAYTQAPAATASAESGGRKRSMSEPSVLPPLEVKHRSAVANQPKSCWATANSGVSATAAKAARGRRRRKSVHTATRPKATSSLRRQRTKCTRSLPMANDLLAQITAMLPEVKTRPLDANDAYESKVRAEKELRASGGEHHWHVAKTRTDAVLGFKHTRHLRSAGYESWCFANNSSEERGRYEVLSAFLFDETVPFYRKRDVSSTQRGITLVVGRLESSGSEAVRSVLFDRERFSERAASEWWKNNCQRFACDL